MKTLFTIIALLVLSACNKEKAICYTVNLSQSGINSPVAESIGKQNKNLSISWKRNDAGIYQGDISGVKFSKSMQFIDQSSNVDHEIRMHVTDDYIQVYTREWNHETESWEFSDGILNNTSIEFRLYQ